VDKVPFIGYRGISGLLILAAIASFVTGSPSGIWLGAAIWGTHLFCFALLFSALNAFAHEAGRPQERSDSKAINVWWLFPLSWGESFHRNHHDCPHLARFATLDPSWPIIRGLERLGLARANRASPTVL
jgi:stearoyl-CoA desaturase (delta-9 desaturase)